MNNNIKISRVDTPFKIKADDIVTKTAMGSYSKIVHVQNSNSDDSNSNQSPVIIKKSKTEYLDTRTG